MDNTTVTDSIISEENLYRLKNDFDLDFSFYDVYLAITNSSELADHISSEECNSIVAMTKISEQNDRLFLLLSKRPQMIDKFFRIISSDYNWLYRKYHPLRGIRNVRDPDKKQSIQFLNCCSNIRTEESKHSNYNVHREKYTWEIHSKLLTLRPRETVIIHGNLSCGKKWLAIDACCNYAIMKHMDFNIFWLNVGDATESKHDVANLGNLLAMLDNNCIGQFGLIANATKEQLQQAVNGFIRRECPECLVVLVDARNSPTIETFLKINCKLLITTNRKSILSKISRDTVKLVHVDDGFTIDESLKVFRKYLDNESVQTAEARIIHTLCKGNPYLVSSIASNLAKIPTLDNWKQWISSLKFFKDDNTGLLWKPVEKILSDNLTSEQRHFCNTLAIFTHNINIPSSILEPYWKKSRDFVENMLINFDKFYLLNMTFSKTENNMVFSLKYHLCLYLTANVTNKNQMHNDFVDSLGFDNILHKREPTNLRYPSDKYFFTHIGYHLTEGDRSNFISPLYMDFGFLQKKLRIAGLLSTLDDLYHYRDLIAGDDNDKRDFISQLIEFLPTVEEFIYKSDQLSLVDIALTSKWIRIRQEAKQQKLNDAAKSNVGYFIDSINHSDITRQLIKTPARPTSVKFFRSQSALITYESDRGEMKAILKDLAKYDAYQSTVYLLGGKEIVDIQLFDNYFLTLNGNGDCQLWTIKDTLIWRGQLDAMNGGVSGQWRQRNRYTICHDQLIDIAGGSDEKSIQTIKDIRNKSIQISCIYLVENNYGLELFVAQKTGPISAYRWNNHLSEFVGEFRRDIKAVPNIIAMHLLPDQQLNCLMTITDSGSFSFFNLIDNSKIPFICQFHPKHKPNFVKLHNLSTSMGTNFVVVFSLQVISIRFQAIQVQSQILSPTYTDLYLPEPTTSMINCSAITSDGSILLFGTQRGIVLFDVNRCEEMKRISASEWITCLDVLSLTQYPARAQYVLMYGIKNDNLPLIYLQTIDSDDDVDGIVDQCHSKKCLLNCDKMFIVLDNDDNLTSLIAIDCNNFIQIRNNLDGYRKPQYIDVIGKPTILAGDHLSSSIFIGLDNGSVYKYDGTDLSSLPMFKLGGLSITFLKCIGTDYIVAATNNEYVIASSFSGTIRDVFTSKSIQAAFEFQQSFLLLVKSNCEFDILDLVENKRLSTNCGRSNSYIGCDLNGVYLAIGTEAEIYLYEFHRNNHRIKAQHKHIPERRGTEITALSISNNTQLLAIGYKCGSIDIYDLKNIKHLTEISGHKSSISQLYFSPLDSRFDDTIILLSLAEQVCFWNVTNVHQIPVKHSHEHYMNQRFHQLSLSHNHRPQIVNSNSSNHSSYRPNLLSCFKLHGNCAKYIYVCPKFRKFITIDDFGEIYCIQLKDWNGMALST